MGFSSKQQQICDYSDHYLVCSVQLNLAQIVSGQMIKILKVSLQSVRLIIKLGAHKVQQMDNEPPDMNMT